MDKGLAKTKRIHLKDQSNDPDWACGLDHRRCIYCNSAAEFRLTGFYTRGLDVCFRHLPPHLRLKQGRQSKTVYYKQGGHDTCTHFLEDQRNFAPRRLPARL